MRTVQVGRAIVHFGPWRHLVRALIRVSHPPRAEGSSPAGSLFPALTAAVAAAVRADGICVAGRLPGPVVRALRAITDPLPPGEYARFDEASEDVYRLVRDEAVLGVLRQCLRAEPQLLECTLVVHGTEDDALRPPDEQRFFHFDFAGWESLNLFIYLTDVLPDSGAHQVVAGTQRNRPMRDAVRPRVPEAEIGRRFEEQIRTIAGPAGTFFFENTEAFHRRVSVKERRVMLNVLYASHRGLASRGRLTRTYAAYLQATQNRAATRT